MPKVEVPLPASFLVKEAQGEVRPKVGGGVLRKLPEQRMALASS
jgi:hypothetical protein